jgi:predicted MFS family arabinose efflux permease
LQKVTSRRFTILNGFRPGQVLCSLMWSCWSFSCGFSAFLPILLKSKHLHKGGLYESLVINAVAGIPGKLLGGVLVEALGRRRTISIALFVSGLAFFAFAFATNNWQSVGAMFVYTSEAFPTAQRATGSARLRRG